MKNAWKSESKIPAQTRESIKLSNDLETKEFKTYNPLYFYAGCGMVHDHVVRCFRCNELSRSIASQI